MESIMKKFKSFFYDEKGAETAEWALIVGILVVIAVAVYREGGLTAALQAAMASINAAINPAP